MGQLGRHHQLNQVIQVPRGLTIVTHQKLHGGFGRQLGLIHHRVLLRIPQVQKIRGDQE